MGHGIPPQNVARQVKVVLDFGYYTTSDERKCWMIAMGLTSGVRKMQAQGPSVGPQPSQWTLSILISPVLASSSVKRFV